MQLLKAIGPFSAVAVMSLAAGCSTWDSMSHKEKDTAVGVGGGAIVGAAVAGPVGAVVGAGVGGVVGHETAKPDNDYPRRAEAAPMPRTSSDSAFVRSVQQALADRGYSAGPADGRWGPNTEGALRRFQVSQGLQATGQLDARTVAALGV
jgi:osmotically inducible lipoprotein OsmB